MQSISLALKFHACPWFHAGLERIINGLFHLYLPRYTTPMNSNTQMFWIRKLIALFSCNNVLLNVLNPSLLWILFVASWELCNLGSIARCIEVT